MVSIKIPEDCTGCGACYNTCSENAIAMQMDGEGFYKPYFNTECSGCGLCMSVCPLHQGYNKKEEYRFYGGHNIDESIRKPSSSGGMFYGIAREVIDRNGVVFGVIYDNNMTVKHIATEKEADLKRFMGSKYVQSDTGRTFTDAKQYLDSGRTVLYSGTPCQIAGLKLFLGREYESLYTVAVICYGVISPLVFRLYLDYLEEKHGAKVIDYRFRHKLKNWIHFSTRVCFKDGQIKDYPQSVLKSYARNFLFFWFNKRIYNMKHCCHCRFKLSVVDADIWLGDFWKYTNYKKHESLIDGNGTSIICYNKKGERLINKDCYKLKSASYEEAVKVMPMLLRSSKVSKDRDDFFSKLNDKGFLHAFAYYMRKGFNKKNAAVLTMTCFYNYGNRLQNYALQEYLKQFGFDVETICFLPPKVRNIHLKQFTDEYIKVNYTKGDISGYDYYFVGSDQVFNYRIKATRVLDILNREMTPDKAIAFSASFGTEDVLDELKEQFATHLSKYRNISTREIRGKEIVKELTGMDATVLLDPVFLVDEAVWHKLASFMDSGEHAFSFFLSKNPPDIQDMPVFDGNNLSVPDFLGGIKNAALVVTDSYHVTAFAIIFRVPFVLVNTQTRVTSRFDTMLKKFNLECRKTDDFSKHNIDLLNIDYSNIGRVIDKEREKAIKFLIESIDEYDT
jgi:coenzyme F420-reducing hydrogenase beta subunit